MVRKVGDMPKFINKTPIRHIDIVWWQDAYTTTDGSPEFEDTTKSHLTLSMGIVVKEDKDFIHMSHFYDGISSELQDPFTSIPIGMIKHRKKVKI